MASVIRVILFFDMTPEVNESAPNLIGTLTSEDFRYCVGYFSFEITFATSNLIAFEPMSMAAYFFISKSKVFVNYDISEIPPKRFYLFLRFSSAHLRIGFLQRHKWARG